MPRRAAFALLGAAVGVALLILTWFLAFHVGIAERADASVLRGFVDLRRPGVGHVASLIANICDPKPYVCMAVVVVLVALLRRRARIAVAAAAILLGANASTEILKPALGRLHPVVVTSPGLLPVGTGSWPSGHATAAMALALCAVLAVAARWRPWVAAVGAAFAVAVSFSLLIVIWHYPSDVLGGFLLAGSWTLVGVAAVWTADARWPRRAPGAPPVSLTAREALGPPTAIALGAIAVIGLVALARPHGVVAYARAHEAFVVGAAAMGALALSLVTGLMLATTKRRDSGRAPTAAPRRRWRPGQE